jgi:hypothetical protein
MQSIQATYCPLNEGRSEIRLLEILSNDSDDVVKCRLSVSSLKDNPEFTALSYVWGDPKITGDITLNGEIFQVTTNLAAALRYVKGHWCSNFPHQDSNIFRIWVDAICINQTDDIERSSQVNLVREIYSKAELVLSWLGHGLDEIDLAFDILKTIAKETGELGNQPAGVEWLKNYPTWCVEFEPNKAYLDSIQTFFKLPYWRRVWIFQELVLGTRILVVHGSTNMAYEDLYQANEWILSTRESIDSGEIQMPDFLHLDIWIRLSDPYFDVAVILKVSLCKKPGVEVGPWVMFYHCSTLQATDPRDHIMDSLG